MTVGKSMRGRMLWFNEDKGHGYIQTEADERLYVDEAAFVDGHPVGPCAGLAVEFVISDEAHGRTAQQARLIEEVAPRRARRRHMR